MFVLRLSFVTYKKKKKIFFPGGTFVNLKSMEEMLIVNYLGVKNLFISTM